MYKIKKILIISLKKYIDIFSKKTYNNYRENKQQA